MLAETNLLKVQTITAKLAKQIQVVKYDSAPGSLHTEIREQLTKDYVRPAGWVLEEVLPHSHMTASGRYWLVQMKGQYYWFVAPEKNSELDKLHQPHNNQLFVS